MPLVTADDLCAAAEAMLRAHLPVLAESLGLKPIQEWQQVPTPEALSTADTPALAIACPGLATPPTKRSTGYDAPWRLVVGVYDRGEDHTDTQARTRKWAAAVRQVLVQHPTLGGVAAGVRWVGEEYAERPERSSARTLGGCAVAVDVTARDVIAHEPYVSPDQPGSVRPVVEATHSTVTIRRPSTPQE